MMINFLKADQSGKSRDEDALIAWTWKKYLDTNATDPNILLRFPMTKVDMNKESCLFLTISDLFMNIRPWCEQWMLFNSSYKKNILLYHKNLLSAVLQK